jgi:hypothetical protein
MNIHHRINFKANHGRKLPSDAEVALIGLSRIVVLAGMNLHPYFYTPFFN